MLEVFVPFHCRLIFFAKRQCWKVFFIFYYQVTTTKCWQRRSAGEGCNLQKLFLKLIFYLSHFPLFLSFLSYQGTILFIWLSLSFFLFLFLFLSFVFSNSLSLSLSLVSLQTLFYFQSLFFSPLSPFVNLFAGSLTFSLSLSLLFLFPCDFNNGLSPLMYVYSSVFESNAEKPHCLSSHCFCCKRQINGIWCSAIRREREREKVNFFVF